MPGLIIGGSLADSFRSPSLPSPFSWVPPPPPGVSLAGAALSIVGFAIIIGAI